MINGLRVKKIGAEEISKGAYVLTPNNPKIIDKSCNLCKGIVEEKNLGEKVEITSDFSDNSFAMVANEYKLNFYDKTKATDIFYLYFGEDNSLVVHLFDLKKTLAGEEVIIHLVEQWKMGIATVKSCEQLLKGNGEKYILNCKDIHIGVITENNDIERRKREIDWLEKQNEVSTSNIASFIVEKRKADTVSNMFKLGILKEFETGHIEYDGRQYRYQIREFTYKECQLFFKDGVLD